MRARETKETSRLDREMGGTPRGQAMVKQALKGQRGFTLIELLAVMSILGILAAMVSSSIGGVGARGQEARLVTDEDTLGTAADRFFTEAFPRSTR